MKLSLHLRNMYKNFMNSIGKAILRKYVKEKNFCIFSNDCFGGEVYRWMELTFNTPFLGLMLMGPCYLKFLSDPKKYIAANLVFIDSSHYSLMNKFRASNNFYPLGLLDDIEIHFLHYTSCEDAFEKWNRRSKRIDFNNLRVKFSVDKDYSDSNLLHEFEKLQLSGSLSLSSYNYDFSRFNVQIPGNVLDATVTFRLSLKYFNLIGWLNEGRISFRNVKEKILGRILFYSLIR